jgi:hypothetical protein
MPIDTAVAATISETASAKVAINSIPSRRRRDDVFSETGDAKPTIPVSSVMVVHPCRDLSANQFVAVVAMSLRTWAKPLKNKGDSVVFG